MEKMMNNFQTEAFDDPDAPYKQETMKIEVTISQTLSSTETIEVPYNFDEGNKDLLRDIVREQVVLPSDKINWYVDDFCVAL